MQRLLVIEDGNEYSEFAQLFLPDFLVCQAMTAASTLAMLERVTISACLIDLRFDRAPTEALLGDVSTTANRLFAGNHGRALRYLQDQQGVLILAEMRARGHTQPAVFIHDFPERRLANLKKLYGAVQAVPTFDVTAIRKALGLSPQPPSATAKVSPREQVARLCHDVGKYIARTACNLPVPLRSPLEPALLSMLLSDLYGPMDRPEKRPSALFTALSGPLLSHVGDPRLTKAKALLATIDALEAQTRAGELTAIERAAAAARQIDSLLRELSRSLAVEKGTSSNRQRTPGPRESDSRAMALH